MAEEGVNPNEEVDEEEEEEEQSSDDRQTLDDLTVLTDTTSPLDDADEQGIGDDTLEWEEPAASQSLSTIHTGSRPTDAELLANLVPEGDVIIEEGEIVPPEETVGAELPEVDAEPPETEPDPEPVPEPVADAPPPPSPPPAPEEPVAEEEPEEEPVPEPEAAPAEPVQFAEAPAAPPPPAEPDDDDEEEDPDPEPEPEPEDVEVTDAAGDEDTAIALDIDPGDADEILIEGVPEGAMLSAGTDNLDGSWTLTAEELTGLTITPPADSDVDFTLQVTGSDGEPQDLIVTVNAVADAPEAQAQDVTGDEDTAIKLDLSAALGSDTDGSESLSVTLEISDTGFPAGTVISVGIEENGTINHTTVEPDPETGAWTIAPEDVGNIYITPPADFYGDIPLTLSSTTTEADGGDTATETAPFTVTVNNTVDGGENVVGNEDTAIALNIDAAGASEIVISDLPDGAVLSAGTDNGDGTWTVQAADVGSLTVTPPPDSDVDFDLTITADGASDTMTVEVNPIADMPTITVPDPYDPDTTDQDLTQVNVEGSQGDAIHLGIGSSLTDTDGSETLSFTITLPEDALDAQFSAGTDNGNGTWSFTAEQLEGLTLTAPEGFAGIIDLELEAVSTETNDTTSQARLTTDMKVLVTEEGTFQTTDAVGDEDNAIPLEIDPGTAQTVTISDIPAEATLNYVAIVDGQEVTQEITVTDGSAELTLEQLNGLSITLPADSDVDFTLLVSVAGEPSKDLDVTVNAVADDPTATAENVSGDEDTAIQLDLSAALGSDNTDGSETLSVTLEITDSGIPAGTVISVGTDNGDGTFTYTAIEPDAETGAWTIDPADVPNLWVTPPANWDGEIPFDLTSTSTEQDGGDTASTTVPFTVSVSSTADFEFQHAEGVEDTAIALTINPDSIDGDTISLSDIPSGAKLEYIAIVDGEEVTQEITVTDGSAELAFDQLNGLTITPPADSDEDFVLKITADGETEDMHVVVEADADAPTATAENAVGLEDNPIDLDLGAALTDVDGSESLSITIQGVPEGAVLSFGTDNGDGTWTLAPGQLTGLTITPPVNFEGDIQLNLVATSTEADGGDFETTEVPFTITVEPDLSKPDFEVTAAEGYEDNAIALDIDPDTVDVVTIGNVPAGAVLSAGTDNGDGTWTIDSGDLAGITITPPQDSDEEFTLTVTGTDVTGITQTLNVPVTVHAVADSPDLDVDSSIGDEDTKIDLNISSALTDTDGSETLSMTIDLVGVPEGSVLTFEDLVFTENGDPVMIEGTDAEGNTILVQATETTVIEPQPDGNYKLEQLETSNQLNGLAITPPQDYYGDITLQVTSTATEGAEDASPSSAATMATFGVTVRPINDNPDVTANSVSGDEDTAINLDISAAMPDTTVGLDYVLLGGIEPGSTLTYVDGQGAPQTISFSGSVAQLSPEQLNGLSITPPQDYNGVMPMTATAFSEDGGVDVAPFSVDVAAIAALDIDTTKDGSVEDGQDTATVSGLEDTAIDLNIGADSDVTLNGIPDGATLTYVDGNGDTQTITVTDGTVTVTPDQLNGLAITPPTDSDVNFELTVSSELPDGQTLSGIITVDVAADADTPTLDLSLAAGGQEDTAIPLTINTGTTDIDDSETLSITIGDIPDGAALTYVDDQGATQAITVTDGAATLSEDQLNGLEITPPADYSGSFDLSVTSTATETDGGDTAENSGTLTVDVSGVADAPSLDLSVPASGVEDNAIALTINADTTDGSETLSVSIANIPEGATMAYVDDQGATQAITVTDGTAELTPDQLNGLAITPPADSDANIPLSVVATSTDGTSTATTEGTLEVSVAADADTPTLTLGDVSGTEDNAIALNITSGLTDQDGSESLSVTITGVPDGATLSAGTYDANTDTWTLTVNDQVNELDGLMVTPPADFSGSFDLDVTATSTEADGGDTAINTGTLTVDVSGVADAPTLDLTSPATGTEDTAIALGINPGLTDTDGSESLSVSIANIPDGATLTYVDDQGTTQTITVTSGSADLTADQLNGLAITPPADSDEDFNLAVTATTTDGTDTATTTGNLQVSVAADADTPILDLTTPATGDEDTAIALSINPGLTDLDGSETLSITIANVPEGAVLSAGIYDSDSDTWTLTEAQLNGLTVTATETDGGDQAVATGTLTLDPNVSGTEDTPIPLVIDAGTSDDSETLSVTISGVPDGATLSAGTDNEDGTWTLSADDLDGLSITPPADSDADFDLGVAVTATDGDDTATRNGVFNVSVTGDADAPELILNDVAGTEDMAIALDLSAALTDVDGSESLSAMTLTGVPAGSVLSVGSEVTTGHWVIQPEDLHRLDELTVTPPDDFSGSFNINVEISSTENDGDTATSSGTLTVNVAADADAPTLVLDSAAGIEDKAIALDINAGVTDDSESLSISISNIPGGAALTYVDDQGVVQSITVANGSATLTEDQLNGLKVTPPEDSDVDFTLAVSATSTDGTVTSGDLDVSVAADADTPTLDLSNVSGTEDNAIALNITSGLTDTDGSESLSVTISGVPDGATLSAGTYDAASDTWTLTVDDQVNELAGLTVTPPEDFSGSFDLSVTSTATEADGGDTAINSGTLTVDVSGEADTPSLDLSVPASGTEDTAIPLTINADTTDDSETLSVSIADIPAGATLTYEDDQGATQTITVTDGTAELTPDQLNGLAITPPADSDVDFTLNITATNTGTLDVSVAADADTPTLDLSNASGDEDNAIALDIDPGLTDLDESESLSITISGVPDGASLNAGTLVSTDPETGEQTFSLSAGDLNGLEITPPADYSGSFNLDVTATATEADGGDTATTTGTLTVDVAAVADEADLEVSDASGLEDTAIALDIDAGVTDSSESLSITISGVPNGASLSAGTDNQDGTWTLTEQQLDGLTITPPADSNENFQLSVSATTTDGTDTETVTSTLDVSVTGDADAPTATVQDETGTEDTWIQLNLNSALSDTDGSESLTITISDVPAGALLAPGTDNGDGTWSVTPAELPQVCILPPDDFSGEITMSLNVTATENDGDTETTSNSFKVTVEGDADAPTVTVNAASGTEDTAIPLTINAGVTDDSETLSITIGDIPDGATLTYVDGAGDTQTITVTEGSADLTPDQLNGLTVTPPADSDTDFTLSVAATTTDGADTETVTASLPVSVAADADTPSLNLSDASGTEDNAIALNISAGLTDTDGSESLSITISGVPNGATLSAGTDNQDGTWTLEPGDLQGLSITPPANNDADFTLSVSATSTDGTDTAVNSGTLTVSVAADADAPTLDLSNASSDEETAIALNIDPGLTDTDGSESMSITISGVPNGATLNAGTANQDGTWTLTEQQLDGLTITPADDYSGSFDLTVTATAMEADGGDTATTSGTITVDVAEEVTLTLDESTGVEDNAIALNIDTSGGPAQSITISGVPDGATLSAGTDNQDGTWTLTEAQLDGLEVTPPADSDADFTLTVTATSADGTESTGTVDVTVTGDADAPTLSADATYSETEAVATTINVPQSVTDAAIGDNTVTVSNVPNGATLSAGTDNGDGTWTLAAGDGLTVTPADGSTDTMSLSFEVSGTGGSGDSLASENFDSGVSGWSGGATSSGGQMKLQGDTSASKTFDFGSEHGGQTVTISFDFDAGSGWEESGQYTNYFNVSANGTEVLDTTEADSSSHSFTVTLDENGQVTLEMSTNTTASSEYMMVDNLEITAGDDWSTTLASETVDVTPDPENLVYDLDITSALTDTDGSETLSITVDDLPNGAVLSAGTENPDGSWTLEAGDLSGLTVSVPDDSGDFNLAVSATATEVDGDTNTVSATVSVEAPDLEADGVTLDTSDASGSEDTAIALDIDATLADTDGSETVSITISGVPDGATLNAGTDNEDGTWTLEAGDLDGLTITPAADSSADFTLTVSATSTSTVDVSVAGVADAPTLSVELGTVTSTGGDDSGGPVGSITVDNPPFEADSFSDGGYSSGSGGTTGWDVTGYAGAWDAESGQFTDQGSSDGTHGVPDGENVGWAGWGGTMSQTVDATFEADRSYELSVEVGDASGTGSPAYEIRLYAGDELVGSVDQSDFPLTDQQFTTATVTVNGSDFADDFAGYGGDLRIELVHPGGDNFVSFDTVELSAADIGGDDGYTRELDITSSLTDTDGSETLSITVSDVPDGVTLSAGTDNGNGTWTLESGDLDGLTMTVPADTTDFDLAVSATATEVDGDTNTVTSTVSVTEPDLESEGVSLSTTDASGSEDRAIALDIGATLTDTDGSETVSITISGVPDGATLSAGTDNQDGTWTLDSGDLSGLTILPAEDSATDFSLTVTATATETTTGDTSTTTSTVNVSVDGIADAPELAVTLGSGSETGGGVTPAGYWNVDETSGSTFYDSIGDNDGAMHGNFDKDDSGVFGTTSAEFRPGSSNEYIEVDHSDALKPDNGAITMWFNADDVTGRNALASSDSSGNDDGGHFSLFVENGQIRLRMQGDNSEGETNLYGGSVSTGDWNQVTVTWGDDGARIYLNGEQVAVDENWTRGLEGNDNPWTFGANQWSSSDNVANNLKDYFDGHMDDIAIYDQQLTADQIADLYDDGVTDMMNSGDPNIEYPLTITTALTDTDGSESLSVTIDGLPDGAVLSAGTENQDGTWTLETGDLSGLTVTVPSGSDDFMLNVSATATDEGGDTRTASQLVQVDVGDDGFDVGTTGTDSADTLTGSSGDDVISGEGGADDIDAGDGDDLVMGGAGAGADTIEGGAGDDHVMGGEGDDLFIFGSGDGADYFNGGDGWSDTVQLEGVDSGPGGESGWTLQVDEGTTYTETESGVEFDAEASGSIVFADGSELTFDNVEKLEW